MKLVILFFVFFIESTFCNGNQKNTCENECVTSHTSLGVCYKGECLMCEPNTLNCNLDAHDGCEIFNTDIANCGSCGNDCRKYTFKSGTCVSENNGIWCEDCPELHENCDLDPTNGCESAILHDNNNCGECGLKCQNGKTCQMGLCDCPIGLHTCGDLCVDLSVNNDKHCGFCGNACDADKKCIDFSCQ